MTQSCAVLMPSAYIKGALEANDIGASRITQFLERVVTVSRLGDPEIIQSLFLAATMCLMASDDRSVQTNNLFEALLALANRRQPAHVPTTDPRNP